MGEPPGFDGVKRSREPATLRFAGLVLDLDACSLSRHSGEAIPLTRGEFAVLRMFVAKAGRVISRDTLLDAFANRHFEPFDRSVDVLIGKLRRKVEPDPKRPRLIVTVPGEGYRFDGLRFRPVEIAKSADAKGAAKREAAPRLSIVVLPFANIGDDPEQDYFADGVTDSLTTDLSRIRGAFVIARSTAFTFKHRSVDARQAARELGVRYVLEGSVQRGQNRVRVNAQLIDGETGAHLWADRFDEDLADLFELQDQVVARLANTLNFELTKAEAAKGARSTNPDATDLVMRGWGVLNQRGAYFNNKDKVDAARALFEQALAIDSNNVQAIHGVAVASMQDYFWGRGNPGTDYDAKILGPLDAVIAVDPDYIGSYQNKSFYLAMSRRSDEALRVADAGLVLNPNNSDLYLARAFAELDLGRFDEAKSDMQQGLRLSPRGPLVTAFYTGIGDAEIGAGHPEAAIPEYRKSLDAGDHTFWNYANLAAAYALLGKMDEAKPLVAETLRLNPSFTVKWFQNHTAYIIPKRDEGFRKAGFAEE
jgi:adenylate cyclase